MSGIAVRRQTALVLGNPASVSTLHRTLDRVGPVQLAKIASALAKVRSRVHAHVGSGIRRSKNLTLTRLPSAKSAIAMDVMAWLQLLALQGRLTRAEPTPLRTDLFDISARLAAHTRRRELKLNPVWPASHNVVRAWGRVQALPAPG